MTQFKTFFDIAQHMCSVGGSCFKSYVTENGCKLRGTCDDSTLLLHYIFVPAELRNTGLLRQFFHRLHMLNANSIVVLAVQSSVLDDYLQRFICPATGARFRCQGGDFVLHFEKRKTLTT